MDVIGHGVDMIEVSRIARMVERHGHRFLERVYTPSEQAYCKDKKRIFEHLAARFAAKEAVLKALGTGWSGGIGWADVEVVHEASGRPRIELHAAAAKAARDQGISKVLISLSHIDKTAIASAIALG
ncbi:MAG: holo-ACP synthase [Phycisphaerales bacterium]